MVKAKGPKNITKAVCIDKHFHTKDCFLLGGGGGIYVLYSWGNRESGLGTVTKLLTTILRA